MNDIHFRFMTLMGQLSARLTARQTAWFLNCQIHDIPGLVAAKLLKPLGNPSPNSIKHYATADLMELTKDRNWMARVSNSIYQHWKRKNTSKSDFARGTGRLLIAHEINL